MSVRDKIVLLSALVIIVGGALVINGRFNAGLVSNNSASETTNVSEEQSVAFPRQLSIKDIDTLKDARGAVEMIREKSVNTAENTAAATAVSETPQTRTPIETRTIRKEAFAAVRATAQVAVPAKEEPAITGSVYVVQKGQTLTDIAIDVFNDKSNAISNAKKIYELNKDILPSMDKIKVGQKLRIPSGASAAETQPGKHVSKLRQFADSMPDKVQFMSSKYVPEPKGQLYVVKKGDSLWTIAKQSLGNGSRYKEIVEMNKEVLGKNSKLSPGMAIVIPN
jgi:nucleoid-associated protein YgaU